MVNIFDIHLISLYHDLVYKIYVLLNRLGGEGNAALACTANFTQDTLHAGARCGGNPHGYVVVSWGCIFCPSPPKNLGQLHGVGLLLSGPCLVQVFGQVASKKRAKSREKCDEDMGDADACPVAIKEILYRAEILLMLIANQMLLISVCLSPPYHSWPLSVIQR